MDVVNLQQQAKDHYRRNEYSKALQYVDRAIECLPSVPLLDLRAACHDKLNNLPAALKSAKRAIQISPEDPTGYLRAGKILKRMEKPSVALDIYAYGLKNIQHVGQGYAALQKEHGNLLSQLAPPPSIDPFTVLPRELAVYILEYLSFRQRIAICRVSKQWDKFIRSEPDLWIHLDLTHARSRCKVKNVFISKCINTARGKLKIVTLHNVYDCEKSLAALARLCPIEELNLLQTGPSQQPWTKLLKPANLLRKLKVDAETRLDPQAFLALLRNCRETLELIEYAHPLSNDRLGLIDAPQLRSLTLTIDIVLHSPDPCKQLTQQSPNLEYLKLREQGLRIAQGPDIDLGCLTQLTLVDLDVIARRGNQIVLPPTIRSLRLCVRGGMSSGFFLPDRGSPKFSYNLPKLEVVDIEIPGLPLVDIMSGLGLEDLALPDGAVLDDSNPERGPLLDPPSKIKKFIVTAVDLLDAEWIQWTQSRLAQVEYLAIREPTELFDDTYMRDLAGLQCLHTLDVSRTSITGVGLKEVVSAGSVKELILNDCNKISRDAVDWARSKGIKVEYKMSTSLPSKRVRYG